MSQYLEVMILMRNYRVIPNVKHVMNVYTSAALN